MTLPGLARSEKHFTTSELAKKLKIDGSPSTLVEIDARALDAIVDKIVKDNVFRARDRCRWNDPRFWYPEGTCQERSQYFAVGNAINFRFWQLIGNAVVPVGGQIDGQPLTGTMYMWRCLRRSLDNNRPEIFNASFLSKLTEEQFDATFADDNGINPLSLARRDRLANLRNLGHGLTRDWEGLFYNLVKSTGGSLVEFVRLSARFRAFDDPLFKLTMVNTLLHLGSAIIAFDADPLPAIDYHLLKQLLRQGLLVPQGPLADKLARQELLSSVEGHELRRAALATFVKISELTCLSGEILDNKWWWNRLKCRTIGPVCLNQETAAECPFFGPCGRHLNLGMALEKTRYY